MKVKMFYVCSRCARRGHGGRCVNCGFHMEKMCLVCNNSESNCYFVNCDRVAGLLKKSKSTKGRKNKQRKKTKTTSRKKGK